MIVPSIDISDGKAVKLVQGRKGTSKVFEDPEALARRYSLFPQINVIDLDAAMGEGDNSGLIKRLCRIARCNVGGGIRDVEKAYGFLLAGACRLIIGTKADTSFLSQLPKERLIVALDARSSEVMSEGWRSAAGETISERIRRTQALCSSYLYTCIDREGLLRGIDAATVDDIMQETSNRLYYAGGISSAEDISFLAAKGVYSVAGMALYNKSISAEGCFVRSLRFSGGLIPTIVADASGRVLMMAYSSKGSLLMAMSKRKGVYYSRSRDGLWEKGRTSGNTQELLRVEADCDSDCIRFTVLQRGPACHRMTGSCFGELGFGLQDLMEKIDAGIVSKKGYTSQLIEDDGLLKRKILEEAGEVAGFRDGCNLVWEVADLLYFVSVLMQKEKIGYDDVFRMLEYKNWKKNIKPLGLSEK